MLLSSDNQLAAAREARARIRRTAIITGSSTIFPR
jgi:hypothetical protein